MLVDVISGSLTILPTSSPIKYVALSYVWGNAPMFKTTTNNIETLLQRGALYEPSNNAVLPDTIRDAIHLVKALGEKYLWVDCLSVVQDAGSEKMDITLRAMARIYASAEFTIVAAGGEDAGHGLRGIGGPSTNRTPNPTERPHLGVPMGMMSLIPKIPTLGRWGMLVENFSSRDLKYEKDAQAAFAGATDIMDATFPDGLLHGIPKFFFDIALLWRPQNSARRREGEPSWSWTGWKNGTINCLSAWYPFYPRIFRDTGLESDWVAIATLKPVAEYRHRMLRNDEQMIGNITITCETLDHEPEDGNDCELVAISEAETSQQMGVEEYGWPDFSFEEYQKYFTGVSLRSDNRKASFYNVMWIKWVGNVAERRGLGVVLKDSWDALQPEIKEFNLG
ncbi:hypothetical protein J4E90_002107 [Alternaria incomplexa]|uniref:uncharacterized protein n=1 Tax=Alternaria incomplexa TaxID=1187928 RepID=UPI00221EA97C|nr:uncharacterized protein J4E90_002107 [Alternaria incomplexa]KAI4919967.1 hypothetical protein J4E90_002107 [Alternaria incomplexa]